MFEGLQVLDSVRLNFSESSLTFLNLTLAFIMFGIALNLRLNKFKQVFVKPKAAIVGIVSQFVLMPMITFILVILLKPSAGVALGMILVASCPGGNISNFMSSYAKGNAELSVTLTAIADLSAIVMTPINFAFWGGLYSNIYAKSKHLIIPIEIDIFQMFRTMIILLGIPLVVGMIFARLYPRLSIKMRNPIKIISLFIFAGYVIVAIANNFEHIRSYVAVIFLIVLIHNALALTTGFSISKIFKLKKPDVKTVTIETGIQNSGLALVLIFNPNLFNGIGGMAFIAALWGIWHIISGLGIAFFWSRQK